MGERDRHAKKQRGRCRDIECTNSWKERHRYRKREREKDTDTNENETDIDKGRQT